MAKVKSINRGVVSIAERQSEFKKLAKADGEGYPGSSERLNDFIDLAGHKDVPPLHRGREAYIAMLTGSSKPAAADWLKWDKPPKDKSKEGKASLLKLVTYFLKYIPGEYNPLRVIAWIRYGDDAVPDPFSHLRMADQAHALIPLAAQIIVEEAQNANINASEFDLQEVLSETVKVLNDFSLTHIDLVETTHRVIIRQIINSYRGK